MRDLPDETILQQAVLHRAIGVMYNPRNQQGNFVPSVFPQRDDAFIFIGETNPLNLLHEEE